VTEQLNRLMIAGGLTTGRGGLLPDFRAGSPISPGASSATEIGRTILSCGRRSSHINLRFRGLRCQIGKGKQSMFAITLFAKRSQNSV
jgi:hypothetical protein